MAEPKLLFQTDEEAFAEKEFLENGYIIREVEDANVLDEMRNLLTDTARSYLRTSTLQSADDYLNNISDYVGATELNEFRLHLINKINQTAWFKSAYYYQAKEMLSLLVGNELAIQKNINLSVQHPGDGNSLHPIHADVLNGDSPYEVVLWTPLVDCYKTKSMFLLSPERNTEILRSLDQFADKTSQELYEAVEEDISWLSVPYGSYLIFSQNLLHGNQINREQHARWSMNCRFKSLFSPYHDKKFGEFFEPITLRPATKLGLNYEAPNTFYD